MVLHIPQDRVDVGRGPEFTVPEDGTYIDRQGNPFWYPKGHKLPGNIAACFPVFAEQMNRSGIDLNRPVSFFRRRES